MQVTGLSRMTIYRLEIAGQFPRRRQLIENAVAWMESDIETWVKARPSHSCVGPIGWIVGKAPADPDLPVAGVCFWDYAQT